MEGLSLSVILEVAAILIGAGVIYGGLKIQISYINDSLSRLEVKQDKHNGLIERMVVVEQSCKSAHKRIDDCATHLKKEE